MERWHVVQQLHTSAYALQELRMCASARVVQAEMGTPCGQGDLFSLIRVNIFEDKHRKLFGPPVQRNHSDWGLCNSRRAEHGRSQVQSRNGQAPPQILFILTPKHVCLGPACLRLLGYDLKVIILKITPKPSPVVTQLWAEC